MKKIVLLTLSLMAGFSQAQDNPSNTSINKTTIDIAKDETIVVSYEAGWQVHKFASYRLYPDFDSSNIGTYSGKIYLDITPQYGASSLDSQVQYQIPISFSTLDDAVFVEPGTEETKQLIVSFLSEDGSQRTEAGSFNITVTNSRSDDSTNSIITDPSGTWYDRSLAGTGFYIMQYGNGTEIRYNGYTKEGQPLWLVSNVIDETWVAGEAKTFTLYEASPDSHTNFNTPPAVVPGVAEWGSLQLQFDSCTSGVATLTGNDGVQAYQLTKLANPINVNCVEN